MTAMLSPDRRQAIAEAAADIDRTFARAGSQLGDGLALIAAHGDSLADLSAALSDGKVDRARLILADVARDMAETRTAFAAETTALTRLAQHSDKVGDLFEQLRRNMRVMTIVTRSARIEGSSVAQASSDFEDFTAEIFGLTDQAGRTIEACLRDHASLRASLGSTLAAQRDFEREFSSSLAALSLRILKALDDVAAASSRDADLVAKLADRSGRVAQATGEAIVSLQSGDNLRQRLEHVVQALDLDLVDQPAVARPVLSRIQSAQLSATADILRQDCRSIDATLGLLAGEASGVVELVRSLYGGENGSTLLQDLQGQLGQAADLLRQCEAARRAVDGVVEQFTVLLDRFEQTVGRLTVTVSDIVLIGINAGLRATHLGGAGRSLVIVAQQLKGTADEIAQDANQLGPVFARMVEESASLRDRSGQSEHLVQLDDTMAQAMGVIRGAGERLASILRQVEAETGRFHHDVRATRTAFAATAGRGRMLAEIASELSSDRQRITRDLDETIAARCRSFLIGQVRSRYSMAAEREIFDRVMHELRLASAPPEPAWVDDGFALFA
jgi:hypothetical protein